MDGFVYQGVSGAILWLDVLTWNIYLVTGKGERVRVHGARCHSAERRLTRIRKGLKLVHPSAQFLPPFLQPSCSQRSWRSSLGKPTAAPPEPAHSDLVLFSRIQLYTALMSNYSLPADASPDERCRYARFFPSNVPANGDVDGTAVTVACES